MKKTTDRMRITVLVTFFLLCITLITPISLSTVQETDASPDVLLSLGFGFKTVHFSIHNRNNETTKLNYTITIKPILRSSIDIKSNCSVNAEVTKNISIPINGYAFARITLHVNSLQYPDWPGPFCSGVIFMGFIIPTIQTITT